MKGHCGVDQCPEAGVGVGSPEWDMEHTRDEGLVPHHTHFSGTAQRTVVLEQTSQVKGRINEEGRQYENIILANYSPASLVLSKIL